MERPFQTQHWAGGVAKTTNARSASLRTLLAQFARRKLGPKVRIHEVALADREGREKFYVPQNERGAARHMGGHLLGAMQASLRRAEYEVQVATLDSFEFDQV
jgi:hypothetical protein